MKIDPDKLGKLEVGWWRAHNEHNKPKLAKLLVEQNMLMYGLTEDEAKSALGDLVFGVNYHDMRKWDEAIEAVTCYYQKILKKSGLKYDPLTVAKLEVGWWRLHDELEHNPDKSALAKAFAKLYASQFNIKIEKMIKAGELKAEATREHDIAEAPNTPKNEAEVHWENAEKLLVDFYGEIKKELSLK